ncbi:MAG: polysaccharide deacetylase family protein, PEP-CTERM locus subfamily, partial [Dehalococcoidia bacterium]|nr:polysaccharide deacetylase family protein, PEP-CTERM locus subfamily [Dehalococcoidia bacterium]MBF8304098.1 polysaccharide deacetylase family protein, locus subfamily [Dehalococcoidia bacterium]
MLNALVIDLEYWFCAEEIRELATDVTDDQIIGSTTPILELLDKYRMRATFAVQGTVAEKHPDFIKLIHNKGHEIASHAYSHKPVHVLGRQGFEEEIEKSVSLLKSITGESPIGFRAPTSSINNNTIWAMEILAKHGFKYEASVCPVWTPQYGVPGAPLYCYRPSLNDLTIEDKESPILELPMTVLNMGVKFPVAGGFWLRTTPLWFSRWALRRVNRERPGTVYIHPWETYRETPRIKGISLLDNFVLYYGINSTLRKYESMLKTFQFAPIRQVLKL